MIFVYGSISADLVKAVVIKTFALYNGIVTDCGICEEGIFLGGNFNVVLERTNLDSVFVELHCAIEEIVVGYGIVLNKRTVTVEEVFCVKLNLVVVRALFCPDLIVLGTFLGKKLVVLIAELLA